jgi:phage baseplate assembly protein W
MADPRIRSFAFPFRIGELAFPKEATDSDAIKASVIQIVTTMRGERVMRPDFGCNAFSYVFENNTDEFRVNAEREIRQSLSKWEKRIRVDAVKITSDDVIEPGQILIDIVYTILSTGEVQTATVAGGV